MASITSDLGEEDWTRSKTIMEQAEKLSPHDKKPGSTSDIDLPSRDMSTTASIFDSEA
jgi:hypothetical protein